MKFLALNVDSAVQVPPPRFKEAGVAQANVKNGYFLPLKSGYFTVIGSCSVKTVADRAQICCLS